MKLNEIKSFDDWMNSQGVRSNHRPTEPTETWAYDPKGGDGYGGFTYIDTKQNRKFEIIVIKSGGAVVQFSFVVTNTSSGKEEEDLYKNWDVDDEELVDDAIDRWCKRHKIPVPNIDPIF